MNNPPAVRYALTADNLAPYERRYTAGTIPVDGSLDQIEQLQLQLTAENGGLRLSGDLQDAFVFYRDDYVLAADQIGRSDFVRGGDGSIAWFRNRGRIYAHQI